MILQPIIGGIRLRIIFAGNSDLLTVDIPLGTIFSSQTAVDQVEVCDASQTADTERKTSDEAESMSRLGSVIHSYGEVCFWS